MGIYEDDVAGGGFALRGGAGGGEVISEKCGELNRRESSKTISSSGSDSLAWNGLKVNRGSSLGARSGRSVWDTVTKFGQELPD